jgi:rifampicin phosphotransferase
MTTPLLLDLARATDPVFGGKANGLARLQEGGLPVPEGFAVSVTTLLPEAWPASIRASFEVACRDLLAGGAIAIRSSAQGEDSEKMSFAGLFLTILDVTDLAAALAAAAACIASGGSERVLSYSGRSEPAPVGLVVERMVPARVAGVVFSRDPTGRSPAVVVEAVEGLGEALVSGRLTPHTWHVYRNGLGLLEARGPEHHPLTKAQVLMIASKALSEAQRRGMDLDMEWAVDAGDHLWWLQARPITAGSRWRPPVVLRSAGEVDDGPVSVWSNFNIRESMPDPIHPLSWSLWKITLIASIMKAMTGVPEHSPVFRRVSGIDLVNGRISFNLNALMSSPLLGLFFFSALDHIDAQIAPAIRDLAARGILRPRRIPGVRRAALWGLLSGPFRKRERVPSRFKARAWLEALAAVAAQIQARAPVSSLSDAALVDEIRLLARPEYAVLRAGMEAANMSYYVWSVCSWIFNPWPEAARALATGVVGNPTTDISLAVDDLVEQARPFVERFQSTTVLDDLRASDDPSHQHWVRAFDTFLDRWGHRAPREFDLATPRWADEPSPVLALVRAGLARHPAEPLRDRLERLRQEREVLIEAAVRRAPIWRRPLMRWAARAILQWMPLREAPKHHAMQGFYRARLASLELGCRLARGGMIERVEDVFFFELEELEATALRGVPPPAALAERRADLERFRTEPPENLIRSDGVPVVDTSTPEADGELRGAGIGGGVGEGPVVRLDVPDPLRVHDGDVLVVSFADPCWTPLFPRAAAVVMEVGGIMCHAAVVARELGVPAVFGVRNALSILADGERVRVDGDKGRVTRLEGL